MNKLRHSFCHLQYKASSRRLKSKEKTQGKEERDVVKGTARRVIVVKSPDPAVFEEAIFVVRDDYLRKPGVSQKELMRQAKRAASGYASTVSKKGRLRAFLRSPIPFIAGAGAAISSIAYVIFHMAAV